MKFNLVALGAIGVISVVLASACSSDEEGDGAQTSGTGGKGASGGSAGSGGRGGTGGGGVGGTGGTSGTAGCTSLALPCDGPEDCATGNICCGHFAMSVGNYVEFQCLPSCANAPTDGGSQELWIELCHPGQTCEDPTYQCSASDYLPSSLYVCFDSGVDAGAPGNTTAGEINCGTSTCTSEQKCCVVTPGEPFCTANSATCGCTPSTPDAGDDSGEDSGTDAATAGAAGAAGAGARRGGPP